MYLPRRPMLAMKFNNGLVFTLQNFKTYINDKITNPELPVAEDNDDQYILDEAYQRNTWVI